MRKAACLLVLVALPLASFALQDDEPLDLVLLGARIHDGSGLKIYAGDIGIRGGRIVDVGYIQGRKSRRTIDVRGHWATPGFIDMHSHAGPSLLEDRRALSAIHQGVTMLVLAGTDGAGSLGAYFGRLEKQGIALNVAAYAALGQLRASPGGTQGGAAAPAAPGDAKSRLGEAMAQGAVGLCVDAASTRQPVAAAELVDLARFVAARGGILAVDPSPGSDPISVLRESLRIAGEAAVGLQILDLNSWAGAPIEQAAEIIGAARGRGARVEASYYPYTAGMTFLRSLLPAWAQEGGSDKMLARLADPAEREKIAAGIRAGKTSNAEIPWDKKVVSSWNPTIDGKSIALLAKERGITPEEALMNVLVQEKAAGAYIEFGSTEESLVRAIRFPFTNVGSDGIATTVEARGAEKPHPRYFGTFPRLVYRYARRDGVLSPEEMIRRMTLMPAQHLGFRDRGRIARGYMADVAIFHPEYFRDKATFEKPAQYPDGLRYLVVNGQLAIDEYKLTGAIAGKVLRGTGRGSAPR